VKSVGTSVRRVEPDASDSPARAISHSVLVKRSRINRLVLLMILLLLGGVHFGYAANVPPKCPLSAHPHPKRHSCGSNAHKIRYVWTTNRSTHSPPIIPTSAQANASQSAAPSPEVAEEVSVVLATPVKYVCWASVETSGCQRGCARVVDLRRRSRLLSPRISLPRSCDG
jgi:hypothetical protein